ncbi:MAG: hypothetical protein WCT14_03715 [Treponemataceae bacterium]
MTGKISSIDAVRADIPTLERALLLQETAAAAGLDWPEAADVWSRINEELAEVKAASEDISILGSRIAARSAERQEHGVPGSENAHNLLVDELGELLFAVVDVCRLLSVDPDQALKRANDLFGCCFTQLEHQCGKEGRMLPLEHPATLKRLWDQTKRLQREKTTSSNIIWEGIGLRALGPQENLDLPTAARA